MSDSLPEGDSRRFKLVAPVGTVFCAFFLAAFTEVTLLQKLGSAVASIGLAFWAGISAVLLHRIRRRGVLVGRQGVLVQGLFSRRYVGFEDIVSIWQLPGHFVSPAPPGWTDDTVRLRLATGKLLYYV